MKIKTSELIGKALDWAVAKCEGEDYSPDTTYSGIGQEFLPTKYSTDWAIAGPIIEQTHISVGYERYSAIDGRIWDAVIPGGTSLFLEYGPTPLIAVMRCYVASKLGDEVEIPDVLRCTVGRSLHQ